MRIYSNSRVASSQIDEFALDDIQSAINTINSKLDLKHPIEFIDFKSNCNCDNPRKQKTYDVMYLANLCNGSTAFDVKYSYTKEADGSVVCNDDILSEVYSAYCKHNNIHPSKNVFAADNEGFIQDDDTISNSIDELADNIEDMQDQIEDIQEDDPNIDINNNIDSHYIAECDSCKGIFISAVIESDEKIDHVTGICPLCGNETDQYLNWVIHSANSSNSDDININRK